MCIVYKELKTSLVGIHYINDINNTSKKVCLVFIHIFSFKELSDYVHGSLFECYRSTVENYICIFVLYFALNIKNSKVNLADRLRSMPECLNNFYIYLMVTFM